MKKIGVLQIDGKIPNLALMEIAGYYEAKGYEKKTAYQISPRKPN